VDKLPEKLRGRLLEPLHDPAVTRAAIVEAINAEAGQAPVSRSSVNRYARRMKKFAEKSRQAREVADAYIERFGDGSRNKPGKIINGQIRVSTFDLMTDIEELKNSDEYDAQTLTDILLKVSKSLRELEQSEKLNAERTESIRKTALTEAAEIAGREGKSAGLDDATLDVIRRGIMGL
jgi:hypothetical protein